MTSYRNIFLTIAIHALFSEKSSFAQEPSHHYGKEKIRKNHKAIKTDVKRAGSDQNRNDIIARAGKSVLLLALIPLVFFLYSNTLDAPFVFDDGNNIRHNPHIRMTHLNLEGLWEAGFQGISSYRPISKISFALNYYFHRFDLPGYHLVNILIHITTGIFLFLFLKATLSLPSLQTWERRFAWVPYLTVLIWLVHPVQSQSVTYIVQRMTSLAAMFYILSLLLYVQARLSERRRRKVLLYTGCILTGFLGFGSKQITATLPLFILLYEWYFFQDLSRVWLKRNVLPIAGVLIVIGTLSLIYLGLNPIEQILTIYADRDFTPGQRILTQFRVVIFYISLIIFPHPSRLNLDRDFPVSNSLFNPITTVVCLAAIIILIGLAIYSARRQRLLSFAILWFLGNLVIESSIIGLEIIFDHRIYLPSMFVIFLVVFLIQRYVRPKIAGFIFWELWH